MKGRGESEEESESSFTRLTNRKNWLVDENTTIFSVSTVATERCYLPAVGTGCPYRFVCVKSATNYR